MAHRRSSPVRSRRRYRPRVSEVPEHAFRITLRAVLIDSAHEVRDVSVRRRLFDEFRLAFQDGFQLEHA